MYQNIAVIGAGPSGLVACKYLKAAGFNVTVFEKESKIGGAWSPDKGFPGLKAQSIKEAYCYTDFYYKPHVDKFPRQHEVYNYLVDYAKKFNLLDNILLQADVTAMVEDKKNGGWDVCYNQGDLASKQHFDFVVIANGVLNKPYIPQVKDQEKFNGKIIHAANLTSLEMIEGTDVVVVGAGKTGLHLATFMKKKLNSNVALVFRKCRMMMPKKFLYIIPYYYLFFQPFRSVKRSYDKLPAKENFAYNFLQKINKFLIGIEKKFACKYLGFDKEKFKCFSEASSIDCGAMLEPDYFKTHMDEVKIYPHAEIQAYSGDNVILNNGTTIKASTVIFSTGYKHCLDFLPKDKQQIIDKQQQIWLYKQVLHPDLLNAAFVCHVIGLNTMLNAEISAQWVTNYLLGVVRIPDLPEMRSIIENHKKYYLSLNPSSTAFSSCITPGDYFWIKDMLKDMGMAKKKKFGSSFFEYFCSAHAKDYRAENLIPVSGKK